MRMRSVTLNFETTISRGQKTKDNFFAPISGGVAGAIPFQLPEGATLAQRPNN